VFLRSRTQHRERIWLVALCCALALAAPQPSGGAESVSPPAPKRGGTLVFAVESEPANYDCHANVSFAFLHPIAPHYSTLLKFDADNYPAVTGDLTESWTVSPDKRVYSFKLRPNVLFHDGTPLTSADVKASYERIVHPPEGVFSARQATYTAIAAIETPDARTIVFRLSWPEAAMLANFASPWNCIYSAAKLKEDPLFPKTHVLGSGPFAFVEHVKGDHWSGKRFDKYFLKDRPYLDGYQARFLAGAKVVDAMRRARSSRSSAASPRPSATASRRRSATASRPPRARGSSTCCWCSTPSVRPSTTSACGARCRSPSTAGRRRRASPTRPT